MKMPDIDLIAGVVAKGVIVVDTADLSPLEAAHAVNKGKKSGLVDDYIAEYITKSITARNTGTVTLDSGGERKGRVEKVITKVADTLKFKKPSFVFKLAKEEAKKQDNDVPMSIEGMMYEILTRVKNIESFVSIQGQLTHWEDLHKEAIENNKTMNDDDYLRALYETFGPDAVKEA